MKSLVIEKSVFIVCVKCFPALYCTPNDLKGIPGEYSDNHRVTGTV